VPSDAAREIGRDFWCEADEVKRGITSFATSVEQGARFTIACGGRIEIGAHLDQFASALWIPGQEVDFEPARRAHIGNVCAAALQLEQHGGLERMTEIRPSSRID
jgi:hypothetical protein